MFYLNRVLLALAMGVVFLSGCSTVPEAERNSLLVKIEPVHTDVVPKLSPKTFSLIVGTGPYLLGRDECNVVRQSMVASLVAKGYTETSDDKATYRVVIWDSHLAGLSVQSPPVSSGSSNHGHSAAEAGVVAGVLSSTSPLASGVVKGGIEGGLIGFAAGDIVSSIAHSVKYQHLSNYMTMHVYLQGAEANAYSKKILLMDFTFMASKNNITVDEADIAKNAAIVKIFSGYF